MNKYNLSINYVELYHTLHFNFRNRLVACCDLKTIKCGQLEIQLWIKWWQIMKKNCTQWVILYEKVSKPILRAVHKAVLTGIIEIHNNWPNCNFLYKYTKTVV